MKGFGIWQRDSGGGLMIASYHSPNNMCWSWILAFRRFRGDEGRWWPLGWRYSDNCTRRIGIRIPPFGFFEWSRQLRVMPYRDLYQSARDERDALRSEVNRGAASAPPPRSPLRPTVIDGGKVVALMTSRHAWGEPQRFLHKTERVCLNGCGIVKVTRHEGDAHWVEFYRDLERIDVGGKTPVCERAMANT